MQFDNNGLASGGLRAIALEIIGSTSIVDDDTTGALACVEPMILTMEDECQRSAIAQSTGFASENRDIVPGIIDGIPTAEAAPVLSDRRPVLLDDNSVSVGVNLDRSAVDKTEYLLLSKRTVQVFDTEAGTQWTDVTHETGALGFKHLPDRLRRLFRAAMGLGIGNALIE